MKRIIVVGGGISGLATAYQIKKKAGEEGLKIDLHVFEKEGRVGGKIRSVKEKGFLCESGPAAFLDSKPETIELSKELGMNLLPSEEAAKKRFIYSGGGLKIVPDSPKRFITSRILSLSGKIRVLFELFTKPPKESEESIASFGRRHLGKEAEEKLINPMVVGIFAGRSEKLSLESCFPAMKELEKAGNGSLIKAMFKRIRSAKKHGVKASPTGNLNSFQDGLEELVKALGNSLGQEIIKKAEVKEIEQSSDGFKLFVNDKKIKADAVILALPAYAASEIVRDFDLEVSNLFARISYAPASVVCMGFRKEDLPSTLNGFGFLVPVKEDRSILGCRWDSSTFQGRATEGNVLLWAILGGDIKPELTSLDDDELIALVQGELKITMGILKKPIFTRIFRHEKAIPQYLIGHQDILKTIEERLKNYPGLFLTGNAFKGVGINDCTRNAKKVSAEVIDFLKR